jgi:hypothetical protein
MVGGRIAVPIGVASTGTNKLYAFTARNNQLDWSEASFLEP